MGKIVTFTGTSGVGKTTIVKELLKDKNYQPIISVTTRQHRPSDFNGEYKYVSKLQFLNLKHNNEFAWDVVIHDAKYGTLKKSLDQAIENDYFSLIILVPDRVKQLNQYVNDKTLNIYLYCFSKELLIDRLNDRGEINIAQRLQECEEWDKNAFSSDIPYHFVSTSGKIDETVYRVKQLAYSFYKNGRVY